MLNKMFCCGSYLTCYFSSDMPNTKETGNKFKKIIVPSKTSTQIASHAKKYFIRQNFLEKRKNS